MSSPPSKHGRCFTRALGKQEYRKTFLFLPTGSLRTSETEYDLWGLCSMPIIWSISHGWGSQSSKDIEAPATLVVWRTTLLLGRHFSACSLHRGTGHSMLLLLEPQHYQGFALPHAPRKKAKLNQKPWHWTLQWPGRFCSWVFAHLNKEQTVVGWAVLYSLWYPICKWFSRPDGFCEWQKTAFLACPDNDSAGQNNICILSLISGGTELIIQARLHYKMIQNSSTIHFWGSGSWALEQIRGVQFSLSVGN